jgi:hypothetical protein
LEQTHPWIEPFGLFALLLSGGALLCASSSALGRLVIWLGFLAVLAGFVGLLRVLAVGKYHLAMPVGGVGVGGAVFLIALCAPSFLGPVFLAGRERDTVDPTVIRVVPLTGKTDIAAPGPDWVDASHVALQQGLLRLQVISVWIDANSRETKTKTASTNEMLIIRLRIHRDDAASSGDSLRFSPGEAGFKLTDNTGKVYRQLDIREASPKDRKVFPVALVDQDIVVEAPNRHVDYLRLEMPAPASGMFRFQIPGSMIRRPLTSSLAGGR